MLTTLELGLNRFAQSFQIIDRSAEAVAIRTEKDTLSVLLREKSKQVVDSFGTTEDLPKGGFFQRQTPSATVTIGERSLTLRLAEVAELGKSYVLYGTLDETVKDKRVLAIPVEGEKPRPISNWEMIDADVEDLRFGEALLEKFHTALIEQTSL